ncbi:MAG UNVERIFIED_CONTAM: hypothetical protein LVR29_07080 [Microcystis novacekii LVE1205-3]
MTWLERQGLTGFSCDRGFPDHDFNFCGRGHNPSSLSFHPSTAICQQIARMVRLGSSKLMQLDTKIDTMNLPIPISFDGVIAQFNSRLGQNLQILAGRSVNLALNLTVFTVVRVLMCACTITSPFICFSTVPISGGVLSNGCPNPSNNPFP